MTVEPRAWQHVTFHKQAHAWQFPLCSPVHFTYHSCPPARAGVDNGNNVDWSNSIDLQILTNIHGSSVPSLALNNTLTSPRPHIIIALSQATKQVGLINLGLRFWQSSAPRYVHYRPVYSLYYLSLGNLSSPEAWPQVQSKQLNEHETSNFLASPHPLPPLVNHNFAPWPSVPPTTARAPSQSYFFCLAVEINSRFGRTFLTNFVLYGESILMVISSISLPLPIGYYTDLGWHFALQQELAFLSSVLFVLIKCICAVW